MPFQRNHILIAVAFAIFLGGATGAYILLNNGDNPSSIEAPKEEKVVAQATPKKIETQNKEEAAMSDNITPSVIMFTSKSNSIIGEEARKSLGQKNTVGRFKRKMGTDEIYEVFGEQHTPESLSALLLKKLKEDSEKTIKHIEEAVVTIPANFSNEAREATLLLI